MGWAVALMYLRKKDIARGKLTDNVTFKNNVKKSLKAMSI